MDRRLRLREPLGRIVVLTFDDGYADQLLYAVPLLRKYGANATFYIISGQVGRPRHLSGAQSAADEPAGVRYRRARRATRRSLADDVRAAELPNSDIDCETARVRARPVDSYAYPSGRFNAQTLTIVQRAGVAVALTTDASYVLPPQNRFELTRLRISSDWSAAAFWAAVRAARRDRITVRR